MSDPNGNGGLGLGMTGEQAAALLRDDAELVMRLESLGATPDLDIDQAAAERRRRAELWLLVEEEAAARRDEEAASAKEVAAEAAEAAEGARRPRRARVIAVGGTG